MYGVNSSLKESWKKTPAYFVRGFVMMTIIKTLPSGANIIKLCTAAIKVKLLKTFFLSQISISIIVWHLQGQVSFRGSPWQLHTLLLNIRLGWKWWQWQMLSWTIYYLWPTQCCDRCYVWPTKLCFIWPTADWTASFMLCVLMKFLLAKWFSTLRRGTTDATNLGF